MNGLIALIVCALIAVAYPQDAGKPELSKIDTNVEEDLQVTHLKEKPINQHYTLENEYSTVSFQVKGVHLCGGVLVSLIHVLTVEDCLKLFSPSDGPIFAVPGIAHSSDNASQISIRTTIDVEENTDLKLVILSKAVTQSQFASVTSVTEEFLPCLIDAVSLGWQDKHLKKQYFHLMQVSGDYILAPLISGNTVYSNNGIGSLLFRNKKLIGISQKVNTEMKYIRFANIAFNAPLICAMLDSSF